MSQRYQINLTKATLAWIESIRSKGQTVSMCIRELLDRAQEENHRLLELLQQIHAEQPELAAPDPVDDPLDQKVDRLLGKQTAPEPSKAGTFPYRIHDNELLVFADGLLLKATEVADSWRFAALPFKTRNFVNDRIVQAGKALGRDIALSLHQASWWDDICNSTGVKNPWPRSWSPGDEGKNGQGGGQKTA